MLETTVDLPSRARQSLAGDAELRPVRLRWGAPGTSGHVPVPTSRREYSVKLFSSADVQLNGPPP
eukprot:5134184-Pyramimonas_sp.AAC.1